jgi:hypothetical protein
MSQPLIGPVVQQVGQIFAFELMLKRAVNTLFSRVEQYDIYTYKILQIFARLESLFFVNY